MALRFPLSMVAGAQQSSLPMCFASRDVCVSTRSQRFLSVETCYCQQKQQSNKGSRLHPGVGKKYLVWTVFYLLTTPDSISQWSQMATKQPPAFPTPWHKLQLHLLACSQEHGPHWLVFMLLQLLCHQLELTTRPCNRCAKPVGSMKVRPLTVVQKSFHSQLALQ